MWVVKLDSRGIKSWKKENLGSKTIATKKISKEKHKSSIRKSPSKKTVGTSTTRNPSIQWEIIGLDASGNIRNGMSTIVTDYKKILADVNKKKTNGLTWVIVKPREAAIIRRYHKYE